MKIVIKNERPISWNEFYSAGHWRKRQQYAKYVHDLVRYHKPRVIEKLSYPVSIKMTVYFDKRPLDADNICAKIFIDGLKGWLLEDDNPKYVLSVETESRVDKKNPRIEIDIASITTS